VFITSPSTVYIDTSVKSSYYSQNDEDAKRSPRKRSHLTARVKVIQTLEQKCWLSVRTVLKHGEFEIQDLIAFIGNYFMLSGLKTMLAQTPLMNFQTTSVSFIV
jgi:hypothetical protein